LLLLLLLLLFLFILVLFFCLSFSLLADLPKVMSIGTDVQRQAMWYASLTNYVGSWLLVGHLDIHKNDGTLGMGPGSSKTAGGKVATDIHGFIRSICVMEERRKEESVSRRFNHHLDRISAYEVDAKDRQELAVVGRVMSLNHYF
jgi:hypothetical protein